MASPLVQFRMAEEDVERIEQARKRRGLKRADWLREVVLSAANAELGQRRESGRAGADPYAALRSRART